MADIRNDSAWNPRVVRIEKSSVGQIAAGTTFRGVYKGLGSLETELLDYQRPTRLHFRSSGPRMRLTGTFTFTSTPHGTSLVLQAELQPQGLFKLLEPAMAPVLKRQNAAAAARLKAALEQK
ncbi:MAG: SRPBCC family protein [Chloroflexi bacterium]|nr:SRPBCC family protein [Chloroflexota bacterium]